MEQLDGFITRREAQELWMPPAYRVRACDRTVRDYLGHFGIRGHQKGRFSRLDLLQMASAYDRWLEDGLADSRPKWLPLQSMAQEEPAPQEPQIAVTQSPTAETLELQGEQ